MGNLVLMGWCMLSLTPLTAASPASLAPFIQQLNFFHIPNRLHVCTISPFLVIPKNLNENIPCITPAPFKKDVSRQCFPFRVGDATLKQECSHLMINHQKIQGPQGTNPTQIDDNVNSFKGLQKPQDRIQRFPGGEGSCCSVVQAVAPLI